MKGWRAAARPVGSRCSAENRWPAARNAEVKITRGCFGSKSVRLEVRPDKVTGDAGAALCREALSGSGVDRWMSERIDDARDPRRIRHSLAELVRAVCVLAAQGRRDHDDATALRDDPALRLAASGRAETGDLLDARLREGKAHTAAGGTEFVLGVLARVETHCCREAVVRIRRGHGLGEQSRSSRRGRRPADEAEFAHRVALELVLAASDAGEARH